MQSDWSFLKLELNESAVIVNRDNFKLLKSIGPGIHLTWPWQRAIGPFLSYESLVEHNSPNVHSKDGIAFEVNWRVRSGLDLNILLAHSDWRSARSQLNNLAKEGVSPALFTHGDSCLRMMVSKYDALQLCSDIDRDSLAAAIKRRLELRLGQVGILCHELVVNSIIPMPEYSEAMIALHRQALDARGRAMAAKELGALGRDELRNMLYNDHYSILSKHGFQPVFVLPFTALPGELNHPPKGGVVGD